MLSMSVYLLVSSHCILSGDCKPKIILEEVPNGLFLINEFPILVNFHSVCILSLYQSCVTVGTETFVTHIRGVNKFPACSAAPLPYWYDQQGVRDAGKKYQHIIL